MLTVEEIAFAFYPVTDLARARAFYEGLLGLKVGTTFAEGEKIWIEYEVGGAHWLLPTWAVSPAAKGRRRSRGGRF